MPAHGATDGAVAGKMDDSAHAHVDPEKGGVPAGKGSARGSAEFLAEVERGRSIKVHSLLECLVSYFVGHRMVLWAASSS